MLMHSISVLVPSRGRPESIARLAEAFWNTCRDSTYLHVIVDDDDPTYDAYMQTIRSAPWQFICLWKAKKTGPPGIVSPVNKTVQRIFEPEHGLYPTILGFMGDDHLPRTEGWDLTVQEAFTELKTGVVYGNDLFQGEKLPTQAFLSADIVQTLGFMAPKELAHLYVDNFWLDLGTDLGRIRYLPDVVIEHLHPIAGKGTWDKTYEECNNPNALRDKQAYRRYKARGYQADLAKVRGLLK